MNDFSDNFSGSERGGSFDVEAALRRSRVRLARKFAAADRATYRWLVECRDLTDAFDADAGVYFAARRDTAGVDALVARCPDDHPANRILGIYDLCRPLDEQRAGLTRAAWLSGHR